MRLSLSRFARLGTACRTIGPSSSGGALFATASRVLAVQERVLRFERHALSSHRLRAASPIEPEDTWAPEQPMPFWSAEHELRAKCRKSRRRRRAPCCDALRDRSNPDPTPAA